MTDAVQSLDVLYSNPRYQSLYRLWQDLWLIIQQKLYPQRFDRTRYLLLTSLFQAQLRGYLADRYWQDYLCLW
ncbi:Uncharacterised protein [Vibrio cholerae]|uniref:Uncharacterized protein n=1 Tax=Vibrio cholerae TaxID=666 RepID=A0A655ZM40_VIBCL|nr:Uncharacterised protein [Vibrio cholerae]